MKFSTADRQLIQTLAQQSHVSEGAVEALFTAVQASNGTAAQFNHPDLGGMGQWMAGGMTMIGDFSNQRLKSTVDQLCTAIAEHLRSQPQASQRSVSGGSPLKSATQWWPAELGAPTASGAQNSLQYAYFAAKKRLALRMDDRVSLYDTKDHQINGFSQQQDRQQTVVFQSQKGKISLGELTKLQDYTV